MDQRIIDLFRCAAELQSHIIDIACQLHGFYDEVLPENICESIYNFSWAFEDGTKTFADEDICECLADMYHYERNRPPTRRE